MDILILLQSFSFYFSNFLKKKDNESILLMVEMIKKILNNYLFEDINEFFYIYYNYMHLCYYLKKGILYFEKDQKTENYIYKKVKEEDFESFCPLFGSMYFAVDDFRVITKIFKNQIPIREDKIFNDFAMIIVEKFKDQVTNMEASQCLELRRKFFSWYLKNEKTQKKYMEGIEILFQNIDEETLNISGFDVEKLKKIIKGEQISQDLYFRLKRKNPASCFYDYHIFYNKIFAFVFIRNFPAITFTVMENLSPKKARFLQEKINVIENIERILEINRMEPKSDLKWTSELTEYVRCESCLNFFDFNENPKMLLLCLYNNLCPDLYFLNDEQEICINEKILNEIDLFGRTIFFVDLPNL